MSSKIPTIRQIAWISLIPQLIFLGILILIYYLFRIQDYVLCGVVTYLLLSMLLKLVIAKDQRRGMRYLKSGMYEDAIEYFEKSHDFFSKYDWIDKYRFITLLSLSRICFKEMALVNIGYCYVQMSDRTKAESYYRKALAEFPDSEIAKSTLAFLSNDDEDEYVLK